MTCERGSHAESENCKILLFPTAGGHFDRKVKCPTGGPYFGSNSHCTELNASQLPGDCPVGGGGGWAVLGLTGT